jgi:hypothetical protein
MIELLIWAVYLVGVFLCYVWLEYSKPQVEDNWFLGLLWPFLLVGACVYVPFRGLYLLAKYVVSRLRSLQQ